MRALSRRDKLRWAHRMRARSQHQRDGSHDHDRPPGRGEDCHAHSQQHQRDQDSLRQCSYRVDPPQHDKQRHETDEYGGKATAKRTGRVRKQAKHTVLSFAL